MLSVDDDSLELPLGIREAWAAVTVTRRPAAEVRNKRRFPKRTGWLFR